MRVRRSFSFTDLSGFTEFTDSRGDEEAMAVLASFRAAVRQVASRRGVRVAKWLGDGAMLVGVDAAALVAAVLELEGSMRRSELPLPLRAGLTAGAVILIDGEDYIGNAVNLAARLCDAAQPHELLATPELGRLVPHWAQAGEVQARTFPGFHEPVDVVTLAALDGRGATAV